MNKKSRSEFKKLSIDEIDDMRYDVLNAIVQHSKEYNLWNLFERSKIILNKIKDEIDPTYSIQQLTCDLIIDMLGPIYISKFRRIDCESMIIDDQSNEYNNAKRLMYMVDSLFGRKNDNMHTNSKPIDMNRPESFPSLIEKTKRDFPSIINGINEKIMHEEFSDDDVRSILFAYRALHDSTYKAYKEYVIGLLDQVTGNRAESCKIWDEYITFKNPIPHKNKQKKYSEFEAISGAVGHNGYEINADKTVHLYLTEAGYDSDKTYSILDLSNILNSVQLKTIVYLNAILWIYHLLASDKMYRFQENDEGVA